MAAGREVDTRDAFQTIAITTAERTATVPAEASATARPTLTGAFRSVPSARLLSGLLCVRFTGAVLLCTLVPELFR